MGFYDLSREDRAKNVQEIQREIFNHLKKKNKTIPAFFSDNDTYIRKAAYQSIGRIYAQNPDVEEQVIAFLQSLLVEENHLVRQTAINAAGEIGINEFEKVALFFDKALFDEHYTVRNAVIGSIKKMGEKNPVPVLTWAKKYLHHPDKEIRREICHGIELRGRTHPQEILPLLKQLQFDSTARVKNTLVHVIGQISYKKNCLATVIEHLNRWKNKELVAKAVLEIIDVHDRYKDFAVLKKKEAIKYIETNLKDKRYRKK